MSSRLGALEREIKSLKAPESQPARALTAVCGGFKGASSKIELEKWVSYVVRVSEGPVPQEWYTKGVFESFQGIVFLKFKTGQERDEFIEKIRKAAMSFEGTKIWAGPDEDFETRTTKGSPIRCKETPGRVGRGP